MTVKTTVKFKTIQSLFSAIAANDVDKINTLRDLVNAGIELGVKTRLEPAFNAADYKFDTKLECYQALKGEYRDITLTKYASLVSDRIPQGYTITDVICDRATWGKMNDTAKNALRELRNRIKNDVDVGFSRYAAMLFGANSSGVFEDKVKRSPPREDMVKVRDFITWAAKKNKAEYENQFPENELAMIEAMFMKYWKGTK